MALSRINANSIADDSITVDQIADDGIHGFRNIIINGDMSIAQRATSATDTGAAGVFKTLDRIKLWDGTTGAFSTEQSTEAPDGFEFSIKLACTTADTSLASSEYATFGQVIEANALAHLSYGTSSAKTITVSFHVRSNKTGTYCLCVDKPDSTSYNFVKEFTIDSADTWEHKVITVEPDSQIKASAGAIAIDNGQGLRVFIGLAWGSDYSGATDNTWSSSDLFATNNQVNWMDSTSNNFYLTGLQVEVGDKATPFEHIPRSEQVHRCRRYYQPFHAYYEYSIGTTGSVAGPTTSFVPAMRAAPTFNIASSAGSNTSLNAMSTQGNTTDGYYQYSMGYSITSSGYMYIYRTGHAEAEL